MATDHFNVAETLTKLTLQEKIKLLTGMGLWHTEPIPRLGIRSLRLGNGPHGAPGTKFFKGVPANCFPACIGLGSSFDVELAKEVGEAQANEFRSKSVHVALGPTVNIQRSPLGGRGFECFSEDPYLSGVMSAAYINGLQSKGVSTTIKHFVANDQEFEKFSISCEISERALREIYLKPFEIAIKASNPRALMTAYNRVNGIHVSETKRLLVDILREEWGFKGTIMSDWTGTYSTTGSIKATVDLEMPGPTVMRGKALERALNAQKITMKDIDDRAKKIFIQVLELYKHAAASGIPFDGPEDSFDTPEQRRILRTAAADTIVLLKNEKSLLPLTSQNAKKVAVIGQNALFGAPSGGGSAGIKPGYIISPLEGIMTAAQEIGASVGYSIGATSHKDLPVLDAFIRNPVDGQPGALIEFWNEPPTVDFVSDSVDISLDLPPPAWSTSTRSADIFLFDNIDETKVNRNCWSRYTTSFIPEEDGDCDISMSVAGDGVLFVDGKFVLDLRNAPLGRTFRGTASINMSTVLNGLKKNQEYTLEVRLSSKSVNERGLHFQCWGGLRLGAMKKMDKEVAIQDAVALARESDVAIVVVGLNAEWETSGFDRPDMDIPGLSNRLIAKIFESQPNTVVVIQSGSPIGMPWADAAQTIVQDFYGGSEQGNGLADILFGKVNPSAKLSLTFPKRLEDNPTYPSLAQEAGKLVYSEGIFVGYRGYEIKKIEPLFAFGHGLSYSKFEYAEMEVSPITSEGKFSVSFQVTNTSSVEGREVSQLYVTDPESTLPKAIKELKGFSKTSLKAGESKKVTIECNRNALAYYDDQQACWVAEQGVFYILVASSSMDIRLKGEAKLKKTFTWTGL